jgi:hypothetical protein
MGNADAAVNHTVATGRVGVFTKHMSAVGTAGLL